MPHSLRTICTGLLLAFTAACNAATKPNIVVIFTDDQGYQDLGCFGSPKIKTPNLDQMAAEGLKLTDFYVTTSVCSASRASLLTGQYPMRTGVYAAYFPNTGGLTPEAITIAEVLKPAGYRTGAFGKWHLGDQDHYLPTNQGFEAYYGVPYSNDMYIGPTQRFAENAVFRAGHDLASAQALQERVMAAIKDGRKPWKMDAEIKDLVPIMRGTQIVEFPADQSTLTQRFFDEAIAFADQAGEDPFFLYITPSMPHVPLFASEAFAGKSERGLYGDVIEEIDHHVGRLIEHLRSINKLDNTLIVFASDNGPWLPYKDHAGSAAPFRGGKFNSYDGGVRVPCVVHWPSTVPSGSVSDQAVSTIDLLPTFAALAGADLPENHKIDGIDLTHWLANPTKPIADRPFFISWQGKITAVRAGQYKLLPKGDPKASVPAPVNGKSRGPELYDLRQEPSELNNLAEQMPEKVKALQTLIDAFE